MTSGNQTGQSGLHLWELADRVLRNKINENATTIERAVAGKCEVVFGSYSGNGASYRVISLGFTPRAVILVSADGEMIVPSSSYDISGGVFFPGSTHSKCGVMTGGFKVSSDSNGGVSTNGTAPGLSPYFYIAFR